MILILVWKNKQRKSLKNKKKAWKKEERKKPEPVWLSLANLKNYYDTITIKTTQEWKISMLKI